MHKQAKPPTTSSDLAVRSFQTNRLIKGSSPYFVWNQQNNNGNVLLLGSSTLGNFIINFAEQPFNLISVSTNTSSSQILEIEECPPIWFYIRNESLLHSITISPQINGGQTSFDSSNNYIIPPDSYSLIATTPGMPPLSVSLQNPVSLTLL